jgi:hypothetical protein
MIRRPPSRVLKLDFLVQQAECEEQSDFLIIVIRERILAGQREFDLILWLPADGWSNGPSRFNWCFRTRLFPQTL